MSLHKGKYAHRAVARAVINGTLIKPKNCEECNVEPRRIEAHHPNGYDEEHWLDIEWLCHSCHMRKHNNENSRRAGLSRAQNLTHEQMSEIGKKGSVAAREKWKKLSQEERDEIIKRRESKLYPGQQRDAALKVWVERRARQAQENENNATR